MVVVVLELRSMRVSIQCRLPDVKFAKHETLS